MINNRKESNFIDIENCAEDIDCEKNTNGKNKANKNVKAGKIILWTVCAAIFLCIVLVLLLVGDVHATIDGDTLKIKATLTQSSKISISEIESVNCVSSYSGGNKELGSDLYKISAGTFNNDDYGRFKLYVYNDVYKYIIVKTKVNSYYVFNLKSENETIAFASALQARLT